MHTYQIKKAADLSAGEIAQILHAWDVSEWMALQEAAFKQHFEQSEFHLLTGPQASLLTIARINFDFRLRIDNRHYAFAELVGLVSPQQRKGYGSQLLHLLIGNLRERDIEALGFCEQPLRDFYQKCNVRILYDKATYLRELDNDQWVPSTDDDILDMTLSRESIDLLNGLNEQRLAYFIP